MSTEEFKLIMEAVRGIADGAATIATIYMLGSFLTGPIKYGIVSVAVVKVVKLLVSNFKVEKND